ncbi:hypothetical protein MMC17_008641 [Xylographa soralifera]|nr:hypothetical protein [Xylographa soralifera]
MISPTPIFGTSNVGIAYLTVESVEQLATILKEAGINRIDTAARYPANAPGQSEKLLGESNVPARFTIDTKVKLLNADGKGSLTAAAIDTSVVEQFERLKVDHVNTLYCHAPDPETPLAEQLAAFDMHFRKGEFKHFGVSNFSPEMVEDMIAIAEANGYVKPTVYQGQYNLLCRGHEKKLFPILRKHNIAYNAYSPLAGGFLTGNLTKGNVSDTRFVDGDRTGMYYKMLYDKEEMHQAIRDLETVIQSAGMTSIEAALRWIFHHSILDKQDGVILGASKPKYIMQNMADVAKGPLPPAVVEKMNAAWKRAENVAPTM